MNQTEFPSLNDAVEGFVFQKQVVCDAINVDHRALEVSCVNLISKLENLLAKARELPSDDFVDESADIARGLLEMLSEFGTEYLTGSAAKQAKEEIDRARTFSHTYDEVLKTRPLTNAFLRTFWKVKESQEITTAHKQLGEALVRGCAATFYHAVMLIGLNTDFGKEIDQSTVVYVNELQQTWK